LLILVAKIFLAEGGDIS